MKRSDVKIEADSNFHFLYQKESSTFHDDLYKEYRRRWKEWPKEFHVGDFPLFIDIEATSICNLKCPFCATTFRNGKIKKGFISFETVKRIIDEGASEGLYGVKFNIRGEPLLHPEIYKFIRYAKDKGLIDVYFNTNAMLLTEDMARRLIDAGLDRISISMEGHTKEVYERQRLGANFDIVLSNIKRTQAMKGRLGVRHPTIRIQTVMLPDEKIDFDEYKGFWSKIADEVAYLDYKEMKVRRKEIKSNWACPQIWQRMAVWWDGTILPCNHDDDGLLSLGSVSKIKIKEAWHSKKMDEIRDIHKKGMAHKVGACDGCYLRDSEIMKLER